MLEQLDYGWFMVDVVAIHYRPFFDGALSFLIPLILPSNSRTKSYRKKRKKEKARML